MSLLKYKKYSGSAEVSVEDGVVFGKVLHIRDLITYEAEKISELQCAFEAAVDDYLADCAEDGRDADEPFKGAFNVRMKPRQHRELAVAAKAQNTTLNEYVVRVLSCHESVLQPVQLPANSQWAVVELSVGSKTAVAKPPIADLTDGSRQGVGPWGLKSPVVIYQ